MFCGKNILFTIGHSAHSLTKFLSLLNQHKIQAVVDVRSTPFSRYCPQFNRQVLARSLRDNKINYVFMGDLLGARRSEADCRKEGKVIYERVEQTDSFQRGIARLTDGARQMRVALMCAEKDPLTCHRTILVARFCAKEFDDVWHILEDGKIETMADANERLLKETKLSEGDLFAMHKDRLRRAYKKRGELIAHEEEMEV